MTNQITGRGLHVIKQWERFRATPYRDGFRKDGTPVLSIGFGHSNQLATDPFDETSQWSEDFAAEVLNRDLAYFGGLLGAELKRDVPDEIWSILLSLAMNKGVARLAGSGQWQILHDTREYPFENFCEAILRYAVEAPNKITGEMEEKRGLRWRRIAEAGIFLQDRQKGYL